MLNSVGRMAGDRNAVIHSMRATHLPVGALIPQALRHSAKGGTVMCAGIHMSNVPEFPYSILWGERSVRSIANLTRHDGEAFLDLAPQVYVRRKQ